MAGKRERSHKSRRGCSVPCSDDFRRFLLSTANTVQPKNDRQGRIAASCGPKPPNPNPLIRGTLIPVNSYTRKVAARRAGKIAALLDWWTGDKYLRPLLRPTFKG